MDLGCTLPVNLSEYLVVGIRLRLDRKKAAQIAGSEMFQPAL